MGQYQLQIKTRGKGLHLITNQVQALLPNSLPNQGLLNLFIQHTSASLLIQENADPSAKADLETFFDRLVPDSQAWHTHTFEGEDDTTSHMKSSLTQTSLNIPIVQGRLGLGTWQGIYLWEHRNQGHNRKLILTVVEIV